jgi:hypothetical protein
MLRSIQGMSSSDSSRFRTSGSSNPITAAAPSIAAAKIAAAARSSFGASNSATQPSISAGMPAAA